MIVFEQDFSLWGQISKKWLVVLIYVYYTNNTFNDKMQLLEMPEQALDKSSEHLW